MTLSATPQGERTRIVLLGRCNVGKSSLINALAGQPVAIVSEVRGTTTDPVRKAMEILPIGPVLLCDTPGLDDASELGELRTERTRAELHQADLALLVVDAAKGIGEEEKSIISEIRAQKIPGIVVLNRCDQCEVTDEAIHSAKETSGMKVEVVSALRGDGVQALKFAIIQALPDDETNLRIVSDLVRPQDVVVLVVPIDSAAPKGRLILPQQQVIRELLDCGAIPLVVRDHELAQALSKLAAAPALVITDSQAFGKVAKIVPSEVRLTSFSMLFARYKGDIRVLMAGAAAVAQLKDGDRVLIAEGCTHHRQKDDIGTVKIPHLLREKTGKALSIEHSSGMGYPEHLRDYALVVHCGGCMLNRREMVHRIREAERAGVPIVNYGILLAALSGILERAAVVFDSAGTLREDGDYRTLPNR